MLTEGGLYRLLAWTSPAFPVGGYAYSHGLEWAVEAGRVGNAETLRNWIEACVCGGAGRVDGALFCAAWRAVTEDDETAFARLAARARAQRGSAETALESRQQGAAFLETVHAAWPDGALARWAAQLDGAPAHSLAVALAAACAGIPLAPAVAAYLQAFAANQVSAGVRLIPLGQTDGQRLMAALEAPIARAAEAAMAASPDRLGSAAPVIDWASMKHETQYTRLFRS